MRVPEPSGRRGASLIELMAAMAIIAILASLLIGPVSRAYGRAKAMEWDYPGMFVQIEEALEEFVYRFKKYDALTPAQLFEIGVFDENMLRFTKAHGVAYAPFSSEDPDDKVILRARLGRDEERELSKAEVLDLDRYHPPGAP